MPNHDKYIATKEIDKLTKKNFTERLKQAKLMTNKILLMFNNVLLKIIKIGKLQTYDLRFFIGKSYFPNNGSQNLLPSQSIFT